jgi:hypothetical protein
MEAAMFVDVVVFGSIAAFVIVAAIGHVCLLQALVGGDWFKFS